MMNFRDGTGTTTRRAKRRATGKVTAILGLTRASRLAFASGSALTSSFSPTSSCAFIDTAALTLRSAFKARFALTCVLAFASAIAFTPALAQPPKPTAAATAKATQLSTFATSNASTMQATSRPLLDPATAARFANLALSCLHREYPNKIAHVMDSDKDALPPHILTPAFYGCFDWHSDVHGHWLLVRLTRLYPNAPFATQARTELAQSLTPRNIAGEVSYLEREDRASFERPYGLAWLLRLSAELRRWNDPQAQQWSATLRPLETEAASRLKAWLPKLHYPIRIGEHDQTAFSFGLMWDWASVAGDASMRQLLTDAARRFYQADRNCPLAYEPSGEDFLSPCLAEADFMRRVLGTRDFSKWLTGFLPGIAANGNGQWLQPGVVTDRADPKLAHIDGLNLSRAWMLVGIAHGLGPDDRRVSSLLATAKSHRDAALPAVTGEHYEGGHWLGTFAVYLTSEAGF